MCSPGFASRWRFGGGNYQTSINQALREYMSGQREALEAILRRVLREELESYRKIIQSSFVCHPLQRG